jgi:NADPH2:quinone reductase
VGSIAIQLARRAGLRVIASASRPESRAWVLEMGAELVVDHRQPLAAQLQALGLDQVDASANFSDTDAYWEQMAELVRPPGSLLVIVGLIGASVAASLAFPERRPHGGEIAGEGSKPDHS